MINTESIQVFLIRLRFIFKKVRFLFANFKRIEVSKKGDNICFLKRRATFRYEFQLDTKYIDVPIKGIIRCFRANGRLIRKVERFGETSELR